MWLRLTRRFVTRMAFSTSSAAAAAASSEFTTVTEGKAKILFPTSTNEVFYNPIQQFNRDLSIACIQEFTKLYKEDVQAGKLKRAAPEEVPITVLEALSATGLRAVRYFHEIPGLTYVVANDLSQDAVKNIERNVLSNGLRVDQVVPNHGDACNVMHAHKLAPSSANPADNARFTVVDLDPYGTAAPFLDSAVQSVDEGGLMCVTCTDMAVLSGRHSDPCFAKYGSVPLTMPSCHENALRILLASITQHAARHKRVIVPLLSLSIDFYVRVFVRVYTSAHETKRIGTKLSQLYRCNGCKTFHLQPLMHESTGADGRQTRRSPSTGPIVPQLCPFCKCTYSIGGPLWSDPIHDPAFVSNLLARINAAPQGTFATKQRMQAMVTLASEELANSPLYYTIPDLCHTVRATAPPLVTFFSSILNAGYKVSQSHANKDAVKTDCPPEILWDIMRGWLKLHPNKNLKAESPGGRIMAVEPKHIANFDAHPLGNPPSRKIKMVRFPENPPHSGPKARAKKGLGPAVKVASEEEEEEEDGDGNDNETAEAADDVGDEMIDSSEGSAAGPAKRKRSADNS